MISLKTLSPNTITFQGTEDENITMQILCWTQFSSEQVRTMALPWLPLWLTIHNSQYTYSFLPSFLRPHSNFHCCEKLLKCCTWNAYSQSAINVSWYQVSSPFCRWANWALNRSSSSGEISQLVNSRCNSTCNLGLGAPKIKFPSKMLPCLFYRSIFY